MPLFCSRPSTRTRVRSEPLAAALKEQDERIKELEAEVAALGRAVHPASGLSQGEQAVRTSMVDDRSSALGGRGAPGGGVAVSGRERRKESF